MFCIQKKVSEKIVKLRQSFFLPILFSSLTLHSPSALMNTTLALVSCSGRCSDPGGAEGSGSDGDRVRHSSLWRRWSVLLRRRIRRSSPRLLSSSASSSFDALSLGRMSSMSSPSPNSSSSAVEMAPPFISGGGEPGHSPPAVVAAVSALRDFDLSPPADEVETYDII